MTKVILDADLLARLPTGQEPLEFCDSAGRIVGHYFPAAQPIDETRLDPGMSVVDLNRRLQQRYGRTLDEILDDLAREP